MWPNSRYFARVLNSLKILPMCYFVSSRAFFFFFSLNVFFRCGVETSPNFTRSQDKCKFQWRGVDILTMQAARCARLSVLVWWLIFEDVFSLTRCRIAIRRWDRLSLRSDQLVYFKLSGLETFHQRSMLSHLPKQREEKMTMALIEIANWKVCLSNVFVDYV